MNTPASRFPAPVQSPVALKPASREPAQGVDKDRRPSIISEGFICEGSIKSDGLLNLDGSFNGEIHVGELVIGPNGRVNGAVRCQTISIRGVFEGAIHCEQLVVSSGARVNAKIFYRSLEVAAGALLAGEFFCAEGGAPVG
ncbi:MAG: hypothetical protein RL026_2827 [Pseudomonadota bacterium]|jgi:cytoskeletal protein CcmA (bactofilin family)